MDANLLQWCAGYRSVAHYLIQRSLDEQAAAAKQGGKSEDATAADAPVLAAESEPSDTSAQTAGGDAACDGDLGHEATADCAADAVSKGVPSSVVASNAIVSHAHARRGGELPFTSALYVICSDAVRTAPAGMCPSTVRRMRQQTLNVLMSQRKAGPPPGLKGCKKVGSLKVGTNTSASPLTNC